MRETTGKWEKIEEMFLSYPLGSEGLATALLNEMLWNDYREKRRKKIKSNQITF